MQAAKTHFHNVHSHIPQRFRLMQEIKQLVPGFGFQGRPPPELQDSSHRKDLQVGSDVLAGLLGFTPRARLFTLGQSFSAGNMDRDAGRILPLLGLVCGPMGREDRSLLAVQAPAPSLMVYWNISSDR